MKTNHIFRTASSAIALAALGLALSAASHSHACGPGEHWPSYSWVDPATEAAELFAETFLTI